MISNFPLGSKENPVIGIKLPTNKFKILGKWIDLTKNISNDNNSIIFKESLT